MVTEFLVAKMDALPMVKLSGEGTGMTELTTSLVSGLQDISNELLSVLGKLVPVILPVVCGVMAVTFAISLFRKFGKAK